jgi:hypothetical protein
MDIDDIDDSCDSIDDLFDDFTVTDPVVVSKEYDYIDGYGEGHVTETLVEDPNTHIITKERKVRSGGQWLAHAIDRPAILVLAPDRSPLREEWRLFGQKTRADGPCVVALNDHGDTQLEWWVGDARYRDGGPPNRRALARRMVGRRREKSP